MSLLGLGVQLVMPRDGEEKENEDDGWGLPVKPPLVAESKEEAEHGREEEEEDAEIAAAIEPLVDAPVLCRLRTFLARVATELGYADADTLVDWHSLTVLSLGADSTDTDILRVLRHGSYVVSRALFWMQNTECLSQLHLVDIMASREWTSRFIEVVRGHTLPVNTRGEEEARRKRRRPVHRMMVAPTAMWQVAVALRTIHTLRTRLAAPLPEDDLVPVEPFRLPRRRRPLPASLSPSLTLTMLREATGNADLTLAHMGMALDRICRAGLDIHEPAAIDATVRRLASRHHSIVATARMLALDFTPVPKTAVADMHAQHERQALLKWVRAFLAHGCACTS